MEKLNGHKLERRDIVPKILPVHAEHEIDLIRAQIATLQDHFYDERMKSDALCVTSVDPNNFDTIRKLKGVDPLVDIWYSLHKRWSDLYYRY